MRDTRYLFSCMRGRKERECKRKQGLVLQPSPSQQGGVAGTKKPNKKKADAGEDGSGTMWAVRSFLKRDTESNTPKQKAKKQPRASKDMNNDRTLDVREMTEIPRPGECDRPEKHLLEREENRYSRPYRPGIDVNLYATKKSVAQGMMDIALLTANASQLKYILKEGDDSRFYFVNVICIGISIALQLIVGVLLILNTRYNINLVSHQSRAELVNNLTIIGIFLITVSNVFVSAFGSSPR